MLNPMVVRSMVLSLGICLASSLVLAQQFGGNPPSLRWRQINSDTLRIIFPAGLDSQAAQVASIAGALSRNTVYTAGGRRNKVNIVFQNQTTVSNGYVSLAPFRSEFQLTPEQNSFDLGSLPWQQQLAIHEYRHVQQYNNYRVGLSRALYILFGEGGQELANSLSVPNWFWEGDAVFQETLVSRQGRGRLPFFFNGYKAIWASGKKYSWATLRNGSLRDYVPDHYPLGYMLVAYGRQHYGEDFWKGVTLDAASFKGLFYPLQHSILRHAGINFTSFREHALQFFSSQPGDLTQKDSVSEYASRQHHFVADEEFPQFADSSHLVYMRSSYQSVPAFFIRSLQDGSEKKLATRAVSLDNYFSCRSGRIVYAAFESDARWNWRNYGVLRIIDIHNGSERKITTGTKYFSPDISADGKQIVAVQESAEGSCDLHILSTSSGKISKVVPNPDRLFYTYPKFYDSSRILAAVRNSRGEMALGIFRISDGAATYMTPFSMNVLGFPSLYGDTVLFTASQQGQDRLFALIGEHVFRVDVPVQNRVTGNYGLQQGKAGFCWSSFSAVGYKLFLAKPGEVAFREIPSEQMGQPLSLQGITVLEGGAQSGLLDLISVPSYAISRYPASFQLLHFHSWRPYISDPDYTLSLESENILNTLQSELYINYNRNEQSKQIGMDGTYAQLFPWLDAGLDYTQGRNGYTQNGQKVFWNEAQAWAGLSVPLQFTRFMSFTNLQFGTDLVYNQRYYQGNAKYSFSHSGFYFLNSSLNFSHQVQQARMQINPRFAQSLSLNYRKTLTTLEASQFLASGYLYLPGVVSTHSLVLAAAFQQRDSLHQYGFSNSFPFSRGYSGVDFFRMYRLAGNYHFPLLYPDWGLGSVIYFLRIRSNLFFDYTRVFDFYSDGSRVPPQYRSFGAEIFFDTKWWNQLPVNFGIRYSRLMDRDFEGRGPNQWEFILPVNLLSR